jgi:undecaprenyl-diphosphatase
MPPADGRLTLRHAVALGLLQGPAELMPVSSSAHTALLPWLAGWPDADLHGDARKSFELALHAGTAAALAPAIGAELLRAGRPLGARERLALLVLGTAPAAAAGLALRGLVERRLGSPRAAAAGLLLGAAAMALADRGPAAGTRGLAQARAADGLALGLAQACALLPGVSRSGATLAAARARGFGREDARTLSWAVALPLLAGGGGAEALRALTGRAAAPGGAALAGGVAAFASTLASVRVLRLGRGPLLPYAVYRCLLAGAVLTRLRRAQ